MLKVMSLKKLSMIILAAAFSSCSKVQLPLVTLNTLDLVNKKVVVREITKYNEKTCALEGIKHPTENLFHIPDGARLPRLHAATCLSLEDFNKVKTLLETECINARDNKK
jgi:hypothetical protein